MKSYLLEFLVSLTGSLFSRANVLARLRRLIWPSSAGTSTGSIAMLADLVLECNFLRRLELFLLPVEIVDVSGWVLSVMEIRSLSMFMDSALMEGADDLLTKSCMVDIGGLSRD